MTPKQADDGPSRDRRRDRLAARPGEPYPLGATWDGTGTNFSVYSEAAHRVELSLFDRDGRESRLELQEQTAFVHHVHVPGVGPGTEYGFRVHGPWAPAAGKRTNGHKLLLDPYAKAVHGRVQWSQAVYPHRSGDEGRMSTGDSARQVPKSVVVNPYFDWGNDRAPATPLHETVIYEAHVKGLTQRHPAVPPEQRGTYAGLTHPDVLEHLLALGVTAIELLPVHQFVHDHRLVRQGLRNYWGYNSIAFLAPHNEYSASGDRGEQVQEFKQMVKALHAARIEVILDVVYNHTAEGDHLGPLLAFKGIDNEAYYRLADDRRGYVDHTGTGNTLDLQHPRVLQLVMDSLRYWVLEMHVDGFRFDLAATLARTRHDFDRRSAFFAVVQQDPVISRVKLIAEPWDLGAGGYQVGNFPPLWSEWNDKYRDTVRDYWRGRDRTLGAFAQRLTGSADLYAATGRQPTASINFVTAHDGFTLRDLVSYDHKHNEANGEDNRDGSDDNRSWNCGVEGDTDDPVVLGRRARQQRNFLTALFVSQGVPMLVAGDEIGRTQRGNNNAYCQDDETSWVDWDDTDDDLLEFTRALTALRRDHAVFRRRRWLRGGPIASAGVSDVAWFRPDGHAMHDDDWNRADTATMGVFLNGDELADRDARGRPVRSTSFFLLVNACHEAVPVTLPAGPFAARWRVELDTARARPYRDADRPPDLKAGDTVEVLDRTMVVLRRIDAPAATGGRL